MGSPSILSPDRAPAVDRWAAWDRLVESTPDAGFQQSSWWADFRATCGYTHFAVALKRHGEPIGGALVLRYSGSDESCFYHIPEGPLLPGDDELAGGVFRAALRAIEENREMDEQVVSHLRIEPRWTQLPRCVTGFREVDPRVDGFVEPRNTLCVDLRADEAAILAGMHPKGRYNIRVAQRHGVVVTEDASAGGVADFVRIYDDTALRQGMRAKTSDYFEDLLALIVPSQRGSLFFAEYGGERIAAALVVYWGERATYFFGGSLAVHREIMAPYLLHWEIMRHARSLGHAWYDLWGVAPADQPDHPWRDISVFKRKFGGVELRLVPTLDYVFDEDAYRRYAAWEAAHMSSAANAAVIPDCYSVEKRSI